MKFDFVFLICVAAVMVINSSAVAYAQDLSALGLPALTTATGSNGETTFSITQILLL